MPVNQILLALFPFGELMFELPLFVALLNFLDELEVVFPEGFDDLC